MPYTVSNSEHVVENRPGTNPDADLGRGLVDKRRRQMRVTQLHMSCECVHDRYAETPIHIDEKNGHAELRLVHVAAPIALALRRPKLLSHNGATRPNNVIENPGVSELRTNGRTEVRWRNKDRICAIPVTDRLDRRCIALEEMHYIKFRISRGKCVGNVTVSKVVASQRRQVHLQDPALKKERGRYMSTMRTLGVYD